MTGGSRHYVLSLFFYFMAVINPHVHTEQEVLNSSFDETFGVLVTEPVRRNTGATALEYFNPATEEKQDALNLAVHAEDSAHVTGDKGIPIWGVRVDAYPPDGGVFGADGDYTPIATNYKGDVKVVPGDATGLPISEAESAITATSVDASSSGDNTIVSITNTPKLYYVCLSANGANSADVTAIVKIGATTKYKVSLKAGAIWARNIGAEKRYVTGSAGEDIIVNLSAAETVHVSVEYADAA